MLRLKNKLSHGIKTKSSSLLTLNEIDELEKSHDWRKHYIVKPKEIGRGHFSKVYQIKKANNEKLFAAKVIRRRRGGTDRLDKIRREAEIIRRLNEKDVRSVMRLFETYESFSDVVLICEFASGGSLFNLLQDSDTGLNQTYVMCIIYKLLLALESMHLENIVHLDIKADNILLREPYPSTDIAICDFGLATQLKKGIHHKELVGTPDYMAPEVISYEKITLYTDMWSVGVLVYHLLTKISPFMGKSKDETLFNVSKAKILFASIFNQPEYYNAKLLISSLCIKDPSLRLSSTTAQLHKWFQDIPNMNIDCPLEVIEDYETFHHEQDNSNRYNPPTLTSSQRCMSMDILSSNLNMNFSSMNTLQSNSTSCENIFIENCNHNDTFYEEVLNKNHITNQIYLSHKLSHVDEDIDELRDDSLNVKSKDNSMHNSLNGDNDHDKIDCQLGQKNKKEINENLIEIQSNYERINKDPSADHVSIGKGLIDLHFTVRKEETKEEYDNNQFKTTDTFNKSLSKIDMENVNSLTEGSEEYYDSCDNNIVQDPFEDILTQSKNDPSPKCPPSDNLLNDDRLIDLEFDNNRAEEITKECLVFQNDYTYEGPDSFDGIPDQLNSPGDNIDQSETKSTRKNEYTDYLRDDQCQISDQSDEINLDKHHSNSPPEYLSNRNVEVTRDFLGYSSGDQPLTHDLDSIKGMEFQANKKVTDENIDSQNKLELLNNINEEITVEKPVPERISFSDQVNEPKTIIKDFNHQQVIEEGSMIHNQLTEQSILGSLHKSQKSPNSTEKRNYRSSDSSESDDDNDSSFGLMMTSLRILEYCTLL